MKKIVGIGKAEFNFLGEDGKYVSISGMMFYTEENGEGRKNPVTGVVTDSFFLSDAKIDRLSFVPAVGDEIEISESRFNGKRRVSSMIKVG